MLGVPVVIDGDNLPSPVVIGLTDMPNIGGQLHPLPASLDYSLKNATYLFVCR